MRDRPGELVAGDGHAPLERLCQECVRVLPVSSAGVLLIAEGGHCGIAAASDDLAQTIEELQETVGEGPCLEAYHSGVPIGEPNLAARGPTRWPRFGPAAIHAGLAAVFSWPLQVAAVRFGALDLLNDQPGELSAASMAEAAAMAELAGHLVLAAQADTTPGYLSHQLRRRSGYRDHIEQAKGMTAVQLGVGIEEAAARLRATAEAEGRRLSALADDVLEGRRRID